MREKAKAFWGLFAWLVVSVGNSSPGEKWWLLGLGVWQWKWR